MVVPGRSYVPFLAMPGDSSIADKTISLSAEKSFPDHFEKNIAGTHPMLWVALAPQS
jgi:hypothetical protein